ncbi:MAG: CoA transferase [Blautia faecis]
MLPLEGIRVLDLTTLSGYCGMELADYGAEVIKVEAPGTGDPLRELAPLKDGASPHHTFRDRGKKSITLDLEKPEGKEIFKKLVATADAVIENFPPGTMEDLGLGYEELSAIKPSLVMDELLRMVLSEKKPVHHRTLIAQAKSAVMHFTGFPENPPTEWIFHV